MQTLAPLARLATLLAIAVTVVALRADPTLDHARLAQQMLGPDTWSRILRIENVSRENGYPRELHALVFELAGILWFYTSVNGTQSLSLHVGRVAEEKNELGTLLREIDAGFQRWREVSGKRIVVPRGTRLPNACFIESVVALRERFERGESVEHPRLLSYYIETPAGIAGHTVLVYERGGAMVVFDAAQPERRRRLPLALGADPLALARAIEGERVVRARELRLEVSREAAIAAGRAPDVAMPATGRSLAMR